VITQTKEVSANKTQSAVSMPILDEAIAARSSLGRDDYDSKRWREEGNDIREEIVSSRSTVINAIDGTREAPANVAQTLPQVTPPQQTNTASNAAANYEKPVIQQPVQQNLPPAYNANKPLIQRTVDSKPVNQPQQQSTANNVDNTSKAPVTRPVQTEQPKSTEAAAATTVNVGSLLDYATQKIAPTYPPAARTMRAAGVVKVEVVLDEKGDVAEVKNATGNSLLAAAAKDAIQRWKFRPVMRDGQAVRAEGYVNFNFTL
jgi:TonB family protein